MFKKILVLTALCSLMATSAAANVSLVDVTCSNNKVAVQVYQSDSGRHRINVNASKSGQPIESQSLQTGISNGTITLNFFFSTSLVPFGTLSVYSDNLQIDQFYRNGCPG